jgi:dethiobiotin synthetase
VTGTDTGVGKTVVSCALLAMLRGRGWRVQGMKPVETGIAFDDPHSDAHRLRAAAGSEAPLDRVRPVRLAEPLAPWVAAARSGTALSTDALDASFGRLADGAQAIVVEGAGGVLVPITERETFLSLFRRWSLDVVVVAANRLGCLNHTLLTVQAVQAAGLVVRGVVLNDVAPHHTDLAQDTNLATLRALLPALPIVAFPWVAAPADAVALARVAAEQGLAALCA